MFQYSIFTIFKYELAFSIFCINQNLTLMGSHLPYFTADISMEVLQCKHEKESYHFNSLFSVPFWILQINSTKARTDKYF